MIKDWRGTPIVPGCHIVYFSKYHGCSWVTEAKVLEVRSNNRLSASIVRSTNRNFKVGKKVTILAVERVVVIPSTEALTWPDGTKIEAPHPSTQASDFGVPQGLKELDDPALDLSSPALDDAEPPCPLCEGMCLAD